MTHTAKRAVRIGAVIAVLGWSAVAIGAIDPTVDLTDRTYGSGEVVFELAQTTLAAGNDPGVGVTIASGAEVTFVAGTSVTLRTGFRVQQGASFRAAIGDMDGQVISAATTDWTESRYFAGPVEVATGAVLDISGSPEAQTRVVLLPGGSFTVHGELVASDCVFTSSVRNPEASDAWSGVVITGSANLVGCTVEYARQGIRVDAPARVHTYNTTFTTNLIGLHVLGFDASTKPGIWHSAFTDNLWYAIKEDAAGDATVRHSRFHGNGNVYYELEDTLLSIDTLNNQSGNYGNTDKEQ